MPTEPDDPAAQALIDDFFAALAVHKFAACEHALAELRAAAGARAGLVAWADYLTGALVNERDHDWASAERIFRDLLRRDLPAPLRGRVLLGLGWAYDYQGRWTEAIDAFTQSLALFSQLGLPVEQAKVWKDIAQCQYMGFLQGAFPAEVLHDAAANGRRALAALADQAAEPWLTGAIWNALGLVYGCLGQWDAALDGFRQHLAMCELEDDQEGIGISYLNIGEIYHQRGPATWPQALEAYTQALAILRAIPSSYDEPDVLANLGLLCRELGEPERALGHFRQALLRIEALRSGNSSEEARAGFLATTVDTYALTVLLHVQLGQFAEAFTCVEQARARAFLDVLDTGSPELIRQRGATPLTLAEVQAQLPPEALLLAYFTTGLLETRDGTAATQKPVRRHRFPPAQTLVFAVTHAEVRVHDTGLSPNTLYPRQLQSVVEAHFLGADIRRLLYTGLIAPVADLIAGRRRVYLIPHGPLHYIPFQALIAPDGGTLLREGGPQLIYAPSATILLRAERAAPAPAPEPCLALAFNGTGAAQLRFGEDEAHGIVRMVGGTAVVGAQPKKSLLYAAAPRYRMLHFSCHGVFDPAAPLASTLYLGDGEHLTAQEVIDQLRLRSDLVCLSACESGLSLVRRGDELIGLVRAFLYAGTRVVVCTLWRVDECSTRILMERFYAEVRAGSDFAEALKRAQLYLRRLSRHEVVAIVGRYAVEAKIHTRPPTPESPPPAYEPSGAYQKSLASLAPAAARATSGDDLIYADPYYWAPFILIGHQSA